MVLLFCFFKRLKPFTSYQFRVKATNDIGDSEYSQESEAITTLQDGKRRGPKKRVITEQRSVEHRGQSCRHAFTALF